MRLDKIPAADKTECKNNEDRCLPDHILEKVATIVDPNIDTSAKTPEELLEEVKERTKCAAESCVIAKVKKPELLDEYFKPEGPRNSTDLFNNYNIDKILEDWTEQYPGFYHVFFQMIDFDKMGTELSILDIVDISKKYKSMGVVLNTDESSGGGKHWFCLYCDFTATPITIEYFNSSGNMPMPEVQAWMYRTRESFREAGIDAVDVIANRIQHQAGRTECGPYSLYYIKSRLNNVPYKAFDKTRITDDVMIEFRQTLFRHT